MDRLKAAWEIRAGVVPGTPIPDYTKTFYYTQTDYEEDGKYSKEFQYQTVFNQLQMAANQYHMQMPNPRVNNWAELSFIWY